MNTSYQKALKAERLKLKRSPVWLAFFALPVISAFLPRQNSSFLLNAKSIILICKINVKLFPNKEQSAINIRKNSLVLIS